MESRDELTVCATLQALRWRVTRVPQQVKKHSLHAFALFDVLDCGSKAGVFEALYFSDSPKVREFTMSFLNALASEFLGRSYLLQRKDIVQTLVASLFGEGKSDSYLRQNALGTLQKFSLRKEAQNQMIQFDVVRWIVETVRAELDSLSDYTLEYATALLMNLSLRAEGKNKCEQIPDVLAVLTELVESDNMQVRTHVNGTLYSLLTRPALKNQALQLGVKEMLEVLMQSSDEQFQRQIQYILNQLSAEEPAGETRDDNEVEDEEEDYDYGDEDEQEEDEEYNDTIRFEGVLVGEDLLTSQFVLPAAQALQQTTSVARRLEAAQEDRMNKSAVSRDARPATGFLAADNPFALSRMGYANPAAVERSVPSAMKSRPRVARTPEEQPLDEEEEEAKQSLAIGDNPSSKR